MKYAKLHCANYCSGKCRGIMIGKGLVQWVDKDKENTNCKPETCTYYQKLVVPIIKVNA